MDLALEMGMTAEGLARTMTERELRRWMGYVQRKRLPTQRLELYLAQLAQIVAITMGGARQAKISDYLIELQPPLATGEEPVDLEAVRKAFGYNPKRKRT